MGLKKKEYFFTYCILATFVFKFEIKFTFSDLISAMTGGDAEIQDIQPYYDDTDDSDDRDLDRDFEGDRDFYDLIEESNRRVERDPKTVSAKANTEK